MKMAQVDNRWVQHVAELLNAIIQSPCIEEPKEKAPFPPTTFEEFKMQLNAQKQTADGLTSRLQVQYQFQVVGIQDCVDIQSTFKIQKNDGRTEINQSGLFNPNMQKTSIKRFPLKNSISFGDGMGTQLSLKIHQTWHSTNQVFASIQFENMELKDAT